MAGSGSKTNVGGFIRSLLGAGPQLDDNAIAGHPNMPDRMLTLLNATFAGLPEPVIALDDKLRVAGFNNAANTIFPSLVIGEPALLRLRAPELVEAIRGALSARSARRVQFLHRTPVDRWFEAVVTPVTLPEPEKDRSLLLMMFNDLTPIRRVEQMRADFIANASHELRTPLASLLGFIETLQGTAKDDAVARERFLAIMRSQATRMARLIDDLLSLSRIEQNLHVRPDTPVALQPLVRQVVDGLQPLALDRDVEIRVEADPQDIVVLGDRDELIRAVENLVENALKYGSAGKSVEVSLNRAGREARIAVRDHGPGIEPEHLPRLTERFYRVDVADSRAQGGTGLGLALVKHVLNHHGGRLTIDSKPGDGAAFTMHLPLHTESAH